MKFEVDLNDHIIIFTTRGVFTKFLDFITRSDTYGEVFYDRIRRKYIIVIYLDVHKENKKVNVKELIDTLVHEYIHMTICKVIGWHNCMFIDDELIIKKLLKK